MTTRLTAITVALAALFGSGTPARSESWPSMDNLVPRCGMIVHARAEGGSDRTLCKVLDVWKGRCDPSVFVRQPPDGFIDLMSPFPRTDLAPGQELLLFYIQSDGPTDERYDRPSMELAVRDGSVMYPPVGELGESPTYTLEEFKHLVTRIVEDIASGIASETPPQAPRAPRKAIDLAGEWRMLLPAGFEHRVTLTRVSESTYRMLPGGLNSSGVYELRDDTLTITAPDEPRMTGFTWKVNSRYLLTLVGQASNTGADYLGAVLFRPRDLGK